MRQKLINTDENADLDGTSSRHTFRKTCFMPHKRTNAYNDAVYLPIEFHFTKMWVPCLYDTGSFGSLISERAAKDLGLEIRPTRQKVRGIGSNNNCIGEVITHIRIGPKAYFPNTKWYVLPSSALQIPAIIGRDPLLGRCTEIIQMLASRRLLFRSSLNNWARVPYINNPKHEKFFSNLDSAATFSASTVGELNASDLVDIVKREIGACINIGDSPEQAARVAQIILDNRAAFKSPDRPVGKFKSYVAAIETLPGKTRHVPQYKVPQRHYGPLTERIKKLKSLGILIPSDNTCGWNTPVGGVLRV